MDATQNKKSGRGRPVKEKEKLSRSINLKLTEDDFESVAQKAANIGMTATQYAREMTLRGRIKPRYTKEELDLRRKIAGMANNLNQIARKANIDGFESAAWAFIDLHRDIKNLLDDR